MAPFFVSTQLILPIKCGVEDENVGDTGILLIESGPKDGTIGVSFKCEKVTTLQWWYHSKNRVMSTSIARKTSH